jgi:CRISPR system Cascade subunit CasA
MTSDGSFDLLTEPWIACETRAGRQEVLGIREVLARAHDLAAVSDESPLVTAATYRMLLAIVDQAYLPKNRAEWVALWRAPTLPPEPLEAYFAHWEARFDLFHAERPFLQVARLDETLKAAKGKEPERVDAWRFVMEMSNYSGHVHLLEPAPASGGALSAPEAARALLSCLAYASGGRIQNEVDSWSGGNLRGGAVVLVSGNTLRETLVLNTVSRDKREKDDVPPWQRGRAIARVERPASGPADVLVWPSRRILLFREQMLGQPVVRQTLSAAGERMRSDTPDPMMAYHVRDPKKPPMAMRLDPERAVWRDASALFDAATGREAFHRPAAVDQLHALLQDGVLPRRVPLSFQLLGLSSNQAAIRFTRCESLPLPLALLTDKNRLSVLKQGLALADEVGSAVDRKALFVLCERALAPGDRSADKNDVGNLKTSLDVMPSFWAELGEAFRRWLVLVGEADDPDDVLGAWKRTLRRAAQGAFDRACRRLGLDARSLQAVAQAQNTLNRVLAELLPEAAPATTATEPGAM